MNNYNDKKAFVEAALIAALTTIFAISIVYLPGLSLLMILIPAPFIILSYRHSVKHTILSFITFSLLTGLLTEIFYTVFIMAMLGPMVVAMAYYIKKDKEPFVTIGMGTISSVVSIFVTFQMISVIGGIDIIGEISIVMESIIDTQMKALTSMELEVFNPKEMLNYMLMIIPGAFIIQSMFTAFINYYFSNAIMKRFDPNTKDYDLPSFSEFTLPSNIVFGAFIIFVLAYFTRYFEGIYHMSLITNIILVFLILFLIQGVAVISYLIKKTKTPKVVRIILIALIFIMSPILIAISLVGMVDSLIDIRKLRTI